MSRGGSFLVRTLQHFYVDEPRGQLLAEAAQTLDLIDAIPNVPANARQLRAQRLALAQLLRQLDLGPDLLDADLRPIDRQPVPTIGSERARHAALARWAGHVKRSEQP